MMVEFKLSMPGRGSWDGKWTGEGRNYTLVRVLSDAQVAKLFGLDPGNFDFSKCRSSWTHRFSDGWVAEVSARVVPEGEDLRPSDGFCGYKWMVDNIIATGDPYGEVTT